MLLFTMPGYESMGAQLEAARPELQSGRFDAWRYHNDELYLTVQTPVTRQSCVILGTIAPPDDQLLTALLLAHTLKKEGADFVVALFPYLAYTRQDKEKAGESMATAWAGLAMRASGFDRLLTVDVHSLAAARLFGLSLTSLSPAPLFAEVLRADGLADATLVAPDNGAIPRCEAVRVAAGMPPEEVTYFTKQRVAGGIEHAGPTGAIGARAILVDDILDTGGTLISACRKLEETGVREIYVMVTHGLFTGRQWQELWSYGVRQIFCTDTIPLPAGVEDIRITRISVLPLLQKALAGLTLAL